MVYTEFRQEPNFAVTSNHGNAELTVESLPVWDLTDLYAGVDDPRIEIDMDAIRQQAIAFEAKYKGSIATNGLAATHLLAALQAYEALLAAEYLP